MSDKTVGTTSPPKHSHDQLLVALKEVNLLMERCVLPALVLGETARQVFDNKPLSGDEVHVGIRKAQLTPEVLSTIKSFTNNLEISDKNITFVQAGVPVRLQIISRGYSFIMNYDIKYYYADEYVVPNPFEHYYKARFIIQ